MNDSPHPTPKRESQSVLGQRTMSWMYWEDGKKDLRGGLYKKYLPSVVYQQTSELSLLPGLGLGRENRGCGWGRGGGSVEKPLHNISSIRDFPDDSAVKKLPASIGDIGNTGSIPGSGRSPGGEIDSPLQYSCLENPMDREAWLATSPWESQSQTLYQKSKGLFKRIPWVLHVYLGRMIYL